MKKCTKKCCDCQNVVGSGELATCRAPQNIDKGRMKALKLVGMKNPPVTYRCDYTFLQRGNNWFDARLLNSCGKEGRWFKTKVKK